jgi:hypothetical protein
VKKVLMVGRRRFSGGGIRVRPKRAFRCAAPLAELLAKAGIAVRAVPARPPRPAADAAPVFQSALPAPRQDLLGAAAAASNLADERAACRAEYFRVVGKRPYAGWDAAALRARIAAHRSASSPSAGA